MRMIAQRATKQASGHDLDAPSKVADYLRSLPGFTLRRRDHTGYGHMGATIVDAGLQAGLRYESVVAPRVQKVLRAWSDATTTTSFLGRIAHSGLATVLEWEHPEKLRRITSIASTLAYEGVESELDLAVWLSMGEATEVLLSIRGVGPKTVDYLGLLVGRPDVLAVDRHLFEILSNAGMPTRDYDQAFSVLVDTARVLGVTPADLDRSIWDALSG